eukprot:14582819-Ditylum_brightwellii.AAC.1
MRVIAQTWTDLIHGSGVKVSLPKSCWWLVWWNWNARKARLTAIDEVAAQIKLTNRESQEAKVLQRKNPSESVTLQPENMAAIPVKAFCQIYPSKYQT